MSLVTSVLSRSRQQVLGRGGFSLIELMVIVSIIGIVGVASALGFYRQLQDREVEAISLDILDWITVIRAASLKSRTCDIQFVTGTIVPGGMIAQLLDGADGTKCPVIQPVDSMLSSKAAYPSFSLSTDKPNFSFSPRGVLHQRIPLPARRVDPVVITVLVPSSGRSRCILLEGILGTASLGYLQQAECKPLV